MKYIAFFVIACFPLGSFAAGGPTNVRGINIGMSKANYMSATGVAPVDCNKLIGINPKIVRSDIEYLTLDHNALCLDLRQDGTGIVEKIQVDGLSYDVVQADYKSSDLIRSLGNSVKAIFLNDNLVKLEIYAPEVDIKTLVAKYGDATIQDNTEIEICKNRIGNEFENRVGNIDAIWTNGNVSAVYRNEYNVPRETCSDGFEMSYYILEDRKKMKLIESAISNFKKDLMKSTAKDSVF